MGVALWAFPADWVADCLPQEVKINNTASVAPKQAEFLLHKAKYFFINISPTSLFSKNVLFTKVPHKKARWKLENQK
jgi:hypothetical protein